MKEGTFSLPIEEVRVNSLNSRITTFNIIFVLNSLIFLRITCYSYILSFFKFLCISVFTIIIYRLYNNYVHVCNILYIHPHTHTHFLLIYFFFSV